MLSKQVSFTGPLSGDYGSVGATVSYTYDSYGRKISEAYPMGQIYGSTTTLTTAYDTMGRPNSLTDSNGATWVQNVAYDYAGRLQSLQAFGTTETRTYNAMSQLTGINWSTPGVAAMTGGLQYSYSATTNNGQITQLTDSMSGESIVYLYDSLKRLTTATSTPLTGSSTPAWTGKFSYDGFGNLTAKTLNGTLNAIGVNALTNQLSSAYYDLNGNMTSGAGATIAYNEDNRMVSAAETSGGIEYYWCAPDGKRIWRQTAGGAYQFMLYGARGELLATYQAPSPYYSAVSVNVYFAGKLIWEGVPNGSSVIPYSAGVGSTVLADRLGTNRANGARFYPFGDEITSTSNDREKFATYTRDSYTGLDYANQRYFASTYGRFNTADPYQASGNANLPSTWNRYAYVAGDPVNSKDPRGLEAYCADGSGSCDCDDDPFNAACDAQGDGGGGGGYAGLNPCTQIQMAMLGGVNCGAPVTTVAAPTTTPTPDPTCEQTETAYVAGYLSARKSPLAAYASMIVQDSDKEGIDDRFIVALAGRETSYGTNPKWNSAAAGIYNLFSNSQHCASLGQLSMCQQVNPYSSYGAAIADVTATISGGSYYAGLNSANDIYNEYNHGGLTNPRTGTPYGPDDLLDKIYKSLGGNLSDVRSPRCP